MSRAWKSPAKARDAAPTPPGRQQDLPLGEASPAPNAPVGAAPGREATRRQPGRFEASARDRSRPGASPTKTERLWFCVWLPNLPLESAGNGGGAPTAIVAEQHGIHRVVMADDAAQAAGVMAGQSANAALALLPALQLTERSVLREEQALERLAAWLERFSSFVCIAAHDVLLLELAGSLRLFGGLRRLRKDIVEGMRQLGFSIMPAIAPTPLGATWLARSGRRSCIREPANLATALRKLPLASLDWPANLLAELTGMGVTMVGDCLRLPREGFTRRFGAERLLELDRALGHLPDPRNSWRAPERFSADYEMTEEQTDRELLLNICRELLLSQERFLLARQLGTQRLCFSFFHLKGTATELRLGCARADRSAERWFELLGIRFEQLQLPAAVIAVRLRSGLAQPLRAESENLDFRGAPGTQQRRFSITQLAERLVARIGEQSVHAMMMVADHRPHYAWRAQSILSDWAGSTLPDERWRIQRPLWMLPEPTLLPLESGYPLHQGCRLRLLDGPERLETGWWDEDGISRDYYTAVNPAGMRLWVFRNRHRPAGWYLHGYFG